MVVPLLHIVGEGVRVRTVVLPACRMLAESPDVWSTFATGSIPYAHGAPSLTSVVQAEKQEFGVLVRQTQLGQHVPDYNTWMRQYTVLLLHTLFSCSPSSARHCMAVTVQPGLDLHQSTIHILPLSLCCRALSVSRESCRGRKRLS